MRAPCGRGGLVVDRIAVRGHPLVVEELAHVAATVVGQQHDDDGVFGQVLRGAQSRDDRHAARSADEKSFLAGEAPGHRERLGVADAMDLVHDRRVESGRPEVLADPFDVVAVDRAARVDRADRVGAHDAHGPVRRFEQVPPAAGDRAAGADAGHEVRDPAVGVAPDLGTGRLVVAARTVLVRVLVRLVGAGDLLDESRRDAVVRAGVVGLDRGRSDDDLGSVGAQDRLLVGGDLVGHDEDAAVPALLGDEGEPDAGVAARRLDDRAAGPAAVRRARPHR